MENKEKTWTNCINWTNYREKKKKAVVEGDFNGWTGKERGAIIMDMDNRLQKVILKIQKAKN